MENIRVTVFTPTYNRRECIKNLYMSLLKQSKKNFEWVIWDDGSNDNTFKLISELIEENIIKIRYFYSENRGKHIAINEGVERARGELFFIVDTDDTLTYNAIEKIIEVWDSIEDKEMFAGVAGLKCDIRNVEKNIDINIDFIDETSIELKKLYPKIIEKAEVYVTKILKKYKFPYFNGENFMAESVIWYKIANDGYKIRLFNENIYLYEYLDDGLTKNYYKKRIDNINSTCYVYNNLMTYKVPNKEIVKYKINYFRYGLTKFKYKQLLKHMKNKRFYYIYYLLGNILRIRDLIIWKKKES